MIRPQGFPDLPPEFEYDTEVVESTDGEHSIFLNWFKKRSGTPKKALLIIHGQGEHGGRYQHFPHYLKDEYDLILAPDLRGHGRSEGIRGHVETFDEYVDDALLAWEILVSRMPENAVCDWFGHSMGGTITLRAFHYQSSIHARNLILSAPCLDLSVQVPLAKDLAARLLVHVWGSLALGTGLKSEKLSHDPAVVSNVRTDQLNHTKATPSFYLSFKEAMDEVSATDLRIPASTRILFQVAGEDEIVSTPSAERYFEEKLHAEHKRIICYPGLYHEIYNELTKDHVFQDLVEFLKEGNHHE